MPPCKWYDLWAYKCKCSNSPPYVCFLKNTHGISTTVKSRITMLHFLLLFQLLQKVKENVTLLMINEAYQNSSSISE